MNALIEDELIVLSKNEETVLKKLKAEKLSILGREIAKELLMCFSNIRGFLKKDDDSIKDVVKLNVASRLPLLYLQISKIN